MIIIKEVIRQESSGKSDEKKKKKKAHTWLLFQSSYTCIKTIKESAWNK
jgi:hypothetical protein